MTSHPCFSTPPATCLPSGALPRQDNTDPGQPRVTANHPGVRLLRRVPPQVRLSHRVEVLHRDIRLPVALGYHRRQGETGGASDIMTITESSVFAASVVLMCLSLSSRSSACTGVCLPPSRHWTRSEPSIESKKCPTTDPCVTSCGRILKVHTHTHTLPL